MRMPRLYQPGPLSVGRTIALDETGLTHAVRVLRLRPGAELVLFDGRGGEYPAVLERAQRRSATVRIERHSPVERESPLHVTLVQGLSRGERMDYTLQKAVELGVTAIQPVLCKHSPPSGDAGRLHKRWQHWRGVLISACEQCGRNTLPELAEPLPLADWLGNLAPDGMHLLLDPQADVGLHALPRPPGPITLLVGPEGGLSDAEQARARQAGFQSVPLGPRVLRTETAGMAALAVLQARWGDLG
jgi:16S rRNA (uracil1498-N3)-methyltransferase